MSLGWTLIEKIGVRIKKKETGTSRPTQRGECHGKVQIQSKDNYGKRETKP